MELIIGGAYQGKLTYAVNKYAFGENDVFDLGDVIPIPVCRCYYHLEALTRRAALAGLSPEAFVGNMMKVFAGAVVISREIGCGIVPMDAGERAYREFHGRVLAMLASDADSVTRIFCGLDEVLK